MSVQTDELGQAVRRGTLDRPAANHYVEVAKDEVVPVAAEQTTKQAQAQAERDWRRSGAMVSPFVRPLLRIIVILVVFWAVATFLALALVPFAAADWVEDWGLRLMASFCQHIADGVVTYALLPVVTFGPQLIVGLMVLLRCYYALRRDLHRRRRRGQE